jgi:hypothetical protein
VNDSAVVRVEALFDANGVRFWLQLAPVPRSRCTRSRRPMACRSAS